MVISCWLRRSVGCLLMSRRCVKATASFAICFHNRTLMCIAARLARLAFSQVKPNTDTLAIVQRASRRVVPLGFLPSVGGVLGDFKVCLQLLWLCCDMSISLYSNDSMRSFWSLPCLSPEISIFDHRSSRKFLMLIVQRGHLFFLGIWPIKLSGSVLSAS